MNTFQNSAVQWLWSKKLIMILYFPKLKGFVVLKPFPVLFPGPTQAHWRLDSVNCSSIIPVLLDRPIPPPQVDSLGNASLISIAEGQPCIVYSGSFLFCLSPSRSTRRCGSTTPCSWASTCWASCWRESPAPSVPWSFWLPSSSSAIVAGATASSTTAKMLRSQTQPTTQW